MLISWSLDGVQVESGPHKLGCGCVINKYGWSTIIPMTIECKLKCDSKQPILAKKYSYRLAIFAKNRLFSTCLTFHFDTNSDSKQLILGKN